MHMPEFRDGRKRGFFYIHNEYFDTYARKCGPAAWSVLCCIARHCDVTDARRHSYPSHQTIADECGIAKNTVKSAIEKLVELGLLTVTPQRNASGQTSNLYVLEEVSTIDPPHPKIDPPPHQNLATPPTQKLATKKNHPEEESVKKNISRKTSCPESIEFTDSMRAFAKENGFDLEALWEQCRDHHLFKGTQGYDWQRGFWTWLRNAKKYAEADQTKHAKVVEDDGSAWEKAAKKAGLI